MKVMKEWVTGKEEEGLVKFFEGLEVRDRVGE